MTTALRFEIPGWHDQAACRPELWADRKPPNFFASGGAVRHAKAVCNDCPVVEQCLADAIANPWLLGIWGGTSESQRLAIRRRRAREAA